MKRKYIVPLVLASVTASTLGAQAHFSFVKADSYDENTILSGSTIGVSGLQDKGTIGEKVKLGSLSSGVVVSVVDPRGQKVTVDTTDNTFTPTLKGYYTVKYSATGTNSITTNTEEFKIYVEGSEYSIKLPTNSEYVVPATVKTGTTIKIPLPSVYEDSNELSNVLSTEAKRGLKVEIYNKDDASNAVTLDAPTEDSNHNYYYEFKAKDSGVYEIIYRYYDNNGAVQDYKTDSFVAKTKFESSDIKLNFRYNSTKPSTATLGNKVTLPSVTAFDSNTNTDMDAYVKVTVKSKATGQYVDVDSSDLSFIPMDKGSYEVSYVVSIPLFGLETKPNTFVISDVKDNESPKVMVVNAYDVTTDKETGKTVVTKVYNDVKKTGEYSAADGDMLYYDATTFATDNPNATDEERQEAIVKAMSDAQYNIPSVAYLTSDGNGKSSVKVKIPAVYVTDNFDDWKDIKVTRTIKSSNGTITNILNSQNEQYKANEWAEYEFTSTGEYTIRYEVKDQAGNSYTLGSNKIIIKSGADQLKENDQFVLPKVTFPAITSYAQSNSVIAFSKPTATDTYDTRPEVKVYYSLTKLSDTDEIDTTKEIYKTNSNGQLTFDLSKVENISTADKIYIHAVAYNDYAYSGSKRLYSVVTREVNIINTTHDSVAPEFKNINNFFTLLSDVNFDGAYTIDNKGMITKDGKTVEAFNQKDIVKLPNITISHAKDINLSVSLKVRDPYGKLVTVKNSSYSKNITRNGSNEITSIDYTVQNGTFVADYSGIYTITYTAKDADGDIISKTVGVRVRDTEKPQIKLSSYDPFTSSVEVGKFIEIPAASLIDNGTMLTDITTSVPYKSRVNGTAGTYWELVEGPSLDTMGTVGFTPTISGDYVIKYYGWDTTGNMVESKLYTITATDTIKPTIVLEKDYVLSNVAWDETNSVYVYAPSVVELYDGYRDSDDHSKDYDQTSVNDLSLSVKVYDPDNNLVTGVTETNHPDESDTHNDSSKEFIIGNDVNSDPIYAYRWQFIADKQGIYTIKYIATDNDGNSTEISKEVTVGDATAPEVEWQNADDDLITKANIGDTFSFNLDMITLDDMDYDNAMEIPEGKDKAEYTVTVNMYNSSNSLVTNELKNESKKEYRWKFEESGTYELRIIATDRAGNSVTKKYAIQVNSEEAETGSVSDWVAPVLITVSALILVGVVVYFVVTSRTKSGNGKNSPKSKK